MVAPMVLARLVQLADPAPGRAGAAGGRRHRLRRRRAGRLRRGVVALEENQDLSGASPAPSFGAGSADCRRELRLRPAGGGLAGGRTLRPGLHRGRVAEFCPLPLPGSLPGERAAGGRAIWPGGLARPCWASGPSRGPGDQPAPGLRLRHAGAAGLRRAPEFRVLTPRIRPRDLVGTPLAKRHRAGHMIAFRATTQNRRRT